MTNECLICGQDDGAHNPDLCPACPDPRFHSTESPTLAHQPVTATSPSQGEVLSYAENLARNLSAKHYPENTEWKPLDGDLIDILTQIDKMTAGMSRSTIAHQPEPVGYVDKRDFASLTDPEQGLCVNIWRHEQRDGDVPLYAAAHQPVTAGLEEAVEALAEALKECLREHGGFTIRGGCERKSNDALALYAALKSEGRK